MIGSCISEGAEQDREDRLELYALGRLSVSEAERIEEHLLICDFCRDRLDEVAAFAYSAREALRETPRRSSFRLNFLRLTKPGGWHPGVAVASAVAALVLAVGMYRVWGGRSAPPVAALHLTMGRNATIPSTSPSRELDIDFADAPGTSKVIILNALGATVWSGAAIHKRADSSITVQTPLPEGRYFARVYAINGSIIHEYTFRVSQRPSDAPE